MMEASEKTVSHPSIYALGSIFYFLLSLIFFSTRDFVYIAIFIFFTGMAIYQSYTFTTRMTIDDGILIIYRFGMKAGEYKIEDIDTIKKHKILLYRFWFFTVVFKDGRKVSFAEVARNLELLKSLVN